MYNGFNLKLSDIWMLESSQFDYTFIQMEHEIQIDHTIESFRMAGGGIDASKMQIGWFPPIKADVFISHSHDDECDAKTLAKWLYEKFKLVSFIDSMVWGNSRILQEMIDNNLCYNKRTRLYDYDCVNKSSSHVHMMLSTALSTMIDESECIIFLNTPSSITPLNSVYGHTESPWIYAEISMTQLLRTKTPERHRHKPLAATLLEKAAAILHPVNLGHLNPLTLGDLIEWSRVVRSKNPHEALDWLYENKGAR